MLNNFTETELSHEQWKDIDGYDGMYQVSNLGRVRSKYSGEWKVMRPAKNTNGYLFVNLKRDGRQKNFYIHRLVAQAFIPNDDDNKTQINHINECKSENNIWNLEWCDSSYNLSYNGLRYRRPHPKYRRNAIKDLYDQKLSYRQNIELLKENGISCSKSTLQKLRKDLGLPRDYRPRNKTKQPQPVRDKIRHLYNPDLTDKENIAIFNEQGIECTRQTLWHLRKDLGLIK